MAEAKIKFNILTVVMIAVLLFVAGYASHRGVKYSKEIKALKSDISLRQDTIRVLSDSLKLLKADVIEIQQRIIDGNKEIKAYQRSISALDKQIAELKVSNANIPPSVKYDSLITVVGTDDTPKDYPFSEPQLDGLFNIYSESWMLRDEIVQYEAYTDVILMNYEECELLNATYENQIELYVKQDNQKNKVIGDKDYQIKLLKKNVNRNATVAVIFGGIATILAILGLSN
jgi:cell division protein FtsB